MIITDTDSFAVGRPEINQGLDDSKAMEGSLPHVTQLCLFNCAAFPMRNWRSEQNQIMADLHGPQDKTANRLASEPKHWV
jgi:hypothetical protein